MYSIQVIENVVKAHIPSRKHPDFRMQYFAWNRTKDDKSDPEIDVGTFTKTDPRGYIHTVSKTNQDVGYFTLDNQNWDYHCYLVRQNVQKQELGIGMKIDDHRTYDIYSSLYLPMIDFEPGLMVQNRHTLSFWKQLSGLYPGKRFYLFDSGNAFHGLLDCLQSIRENTEWREFLSEHEEVVDQKWIRFASMHSHCGVIRTTNGKRRPQPKLLKWINL